MVPSDRRATPPCRNTGWPPSSYSPSGMPQQRSESEMSTMRAGPNMRNASRTEAGWTCWPSLMSSALTCSFSTAAGMTPGLRWWMPGMALYRCVRCVTPASMAQTASS